MMRQQLAEGFQIYAVTPLISESETIDLENAEALHDRLAGEFPDQEVVLLHGKMTAADKEQIMGPLCGRGGRYSGYYQRD